MAPSSTFHSPVPLGKTSQPARSLPLNSGTNLVESSAARAGSASTASNSTLDSLFIGFSPLLSGRRLTTLLRSVANQHSTGYFFLPTFGNSLAFGATVARFGVTSALALPSVQLIAPSS